MRVVTTSEMFERAAANLHREWLRERRRAQFWRIWTLVWFAIALTQFLGWVECAQ